MLTTLIPPTSLNTRLSGLFMAEPTDGSMPDAVELQMSTAGPYFRPPPGEVGLLPLNGSAPVSISNSATPSP